MCATILDVNNLISLSFYRSLSYGYHFAYLGMKVALGHRRCWTLDLLQALHVQEGMNLCHMPTGPYKSWRPKAGNYVEQGGYAIEPYSKASGLSCFFSLVSERKQICITWFEVTLVALNCPYIKKAIQKISTVFPLSSGAEVSCQVT